MKIHSPSFSGSITQDLNNAYANLSGSFTGSVTGSFTGDINVSTATFDNLTVLQTIDVGSTTANIQQVTGSVFVTGSVTVNGNVNTINGGQVQIDGVNVLDSAIAFAIALG